MLLSLSFFLTVSFHDSPYYYGADIVFLFAPFLLGGSGAFSLDAVLARLGTSAAGAGTDAVDRRTALRGAGVAGGLGAFALALGGVDNVLGSHFSKSSTTAGSTTTTSPVATSTPRSVANMPTTSAPSGSEIGLASAIPVGDALAFTDQTQGIPAYCVTRALMSSSRSLLSAPMPAVPAASTAQLQSLSAPVMARSITHSRAQS